MLKPYFLLAALAVLVSASPLCAGEQDNDWSDLGKRKAAPQPKPEPQAEFQPAPSQDDGRPLLTLGTGKLTPERLALAIERGKRALYKSLKDPFNQGESGYGCGLRALAVLALLNCGEKPEQADLAAALAQFKRVAKTSCVEQYQGTYRAGVFLMIFGLLKDPQYKDVCSGLVRTLCSHQLPNGSWGDNSRTQIALLGLKSAEDLGLPVPQDVFEKALKYIEDGQNSDGGWNYNLYARTNEPSYGSMTVAGLTSLYICGQRLERSGTTCGEWRSDKRLALGLAWIGKNFTVDHNRVHKRGMVFDNAWLYYYLYGLERVGMILAKKTIGGHDWYRRGAEFLVNAQEQSGHWCGGSRDGSTEFAMLFLGKGSAPIAMQKLQYDGDWNPDPFDARKLTTRAAQDLATPMTWQVVETGASAQELACAPILYLQGKKAFSFTDAWRKELKLFIDNGGFVFASACCGSASFDRSFRDEMAQLYPDAKFEPLPPGHPVYTCRHAVAQQAAFMLEGLNTGCRTAVLYAPRDVCCAWSDCAGCADKGCVAGAEALKLGTNMIAYALGYNKLKHKLADTELALKASDAKVERGALVIGQLYHAGDWDPDPAALPNLAKTLKEHAGMRGAVAKKRVVLGTDDPGEYSILYLTGHRAFTYTPAQVKDLRAYLDKGGFLLSDPCCGRAEFDVAFRTLCEQLYPALELKRLPKDHSVFKAPFRIERVAYKIGAKRFFPDLGAAPHLEAAEYQGRLTVLYSRFNLGCELQGHACANCVGVESEDAYKIAVNAIIYALSH